MTAEELAPFNDLKRFKDFSAFEKSLPGKGKKTRRRHRRRLCERGVITAEVLSEGAAARVQAVRAVRMKRAWLKARGLTSRAFADERLEAFFASVAGDTERPVGCRLGVLSCSGETIAIEIAFRSQDHAAIHIKVYEPEFELHSPGQLLTEECVQAIFHEGAATYDLLAPDAAYKRDWASGVTKVGDYAIACSRRGRLWIALYLKGMRQGVKSTLALLPVGVRRRLLSVRANAQAILGG